MDPLPLHIELDATSRGRHEVEDRSLRILFVLRIHDFDQRRDRDRRHLAKALEIERPKCHTPVLERDNAIREPARKVGSLGGPRVLGILCSGLCVDRACLSGVLGFDQSAKVGCNTLSKSFENRPLFDAVYPLDDSLPSYPTLGQGSSTDC